MFHSTYEYSKVHAYRYCFISTGKRTITKILEFTPTSTRNLYNLGFGDLLSNGEIDDTANSNNGDMIKIFATVIDILQDFTEQNPSFIILFLGSTPQRTLLYNRILKTYYQPFSTKFAVAGLIETEDGPMDVPFDPQSSESYFGFLIKRI